jgi:hypothetical protein
MGIEADMPAKIVNTGVDPATGKPKGYILTDNALNGQQLKVPFHGAITTAEAVARPESDNPERQFWKEGDWTEDAPASFGTQVLMPAAVAGAGMLAREGVKYAFRQKYPNSTKYPDAPSYGAL